jgi:hypothetical protein
MPGFNVFRHRMQVATHATIYQVLCTEKTAENTKFVKNQNNLAWCLELVIQAIEKYWVHLRDVEKQRVSNGAFWSFNVLSKFCLAI